MRHHIHTLIKTQKKLLKTFGCPGEYFIRPMPDSAWRITGDEDMKILSYAHNDTMHNAVIVRHNGEAMIYRTQGHVCVVAIDCVKFAFIFDGSRELNHE